MESPNSETSTLAASEENKHQENKHNAQSLQTPENGEAPSPRPSLPPSHDPRLGDPSFPFQSSNLAEGGFTDEYRVVSKTGFIPADTALRPIPSHQSITPGALRDPEKAKELKDVKLVTFVDNDPKDPRNYSKLFKWCTSVSFISYIRLDTDACHDQISPSSARCPSSKSPSRQP